jgi:hypothetical protein
LALLAHQVLGNGIMGRQGSRIVSHVGGGGMAGEPRYHDLGLRLNIQCLAIDSSGHEGTMLIMGLPPPVVVAPASQRPVVRSDCGRYRPNLWPDKHSTISEIQENITDHGGCQADQYVLDAGQEYNQPTQRQYDQGVLYYVFPYFGHGYEIAILLAQEKQGHADD